MAELLISVNVRDLHRKQADGRRTIDLLYEQLHSSGLLAPRKHGVEASTIERYHEVFNVALTQYMGHWVLDYVCEVCGDQHLASHDPMEAQLLDGGFVKDWCQASLAASQEQLRSALASDTQLSTYVSHHLQRELSKAHVIVSVLQALGRIHGAAGAGMGGTAAAGTSQELSAAGSSTHRDRGVGAELQAAQLLQQALQLLAWCARQRLLEGSTTGRYASMPEWMRKVQGRRERRPGRSLFLDDLLQELSISGAYPFSSLAGALFTLGCAVRDASDAAFGARLALLTYYLADLGLAHEGTPEGRQLLDDLRATFSIPAPLLATWQAAFLLDAAPTHAAAPGTPTTGASAAAAGGSGAHAGGQQGGAHAGGVGGTRGVGLGGVGGGVSGEDESLSRACDLLVANAHSHLPIKYIEMLVALGRPDVALLVHRAQVGAVTEAALTPSQARSLVELRLRCGLLPEALQLARAHAAAQPDAGARTATLSSLIGAIAAWAVGAQAGEARERGGATVEGGGGHCWARTALLELCFSEEEEEVLVAWLVGQLEAGAPAGDVLPLLLASRWRVPEALGAFKRWADRQAQAGGPCGGIPLPLIPLVDAIMDAQSGLLPLPLRNVVLDGGVQAPARALPPGAAGVAQGFVLQTDAGVPAMAASFSRDADGGWCAPPFITTRIPAPPAVPQTQPPAGNSSNAAAPPVAPALGAYAASTMGAAGSSFASAFTTASAPAPGGGSLGFGPLFSMAGQGAGMGADRGAAGGSMFGVPSASDVRMMKRPRIGQGALR